MEKEKIVAQRIKSLPDSCGIYIFKDNRGEILYIGKALSLRRRVGSYFNRFLDGKTQSLVSKTARIDYIPTSTEAQALIKEASLIKQHLPAYNIAFRDDKSFPFIGISAEGFCRVFIVRSCRKRLNKRKINRLFGPYTNSRLLRQALKTIRSVFPFRSCGKLPKKACLYYRIKLCPAPCAGKISRDDYRENINNIIMLLEGKDEDLISDLYRRMQEKSRQENFEAAAKVRDQIQAVQDILSLGESGGLSDDRAQLQKVLGISHKIRRIEAFDVSNIYGCQACASMVSFYDGKPDKNNYRRFRIKAVSGIDDYRMLTEAIRRRYRRLIREGLPLPDLVLIDGGKGHLRTAKKELDGLNINLPVISIAKEKEEVFTVGRKSPLRLPAGSSALRLIQRIRDESHRFALAYHRILRRKKTLGTLKATTEE